MLVEGRVSENAWGLVHFALLVDQWHGLTHDRRTLAHVDWFEVIHLWGSGLSNRSSPFRPSIDVYS